MFYSIPNMLLVSKAAGPDFHPAGALTRWHFYVLKSEFSILHVGVALFSPHVENIYC